MVILSRKYYSIILIILLASTVTATEWARVNVNSALLIENEIKQNPLPTLVSFAIVNQTDYELVPGGRAYTCGRYHTEGHGKIILNVQNACWSGNSSVNKEMIRQRLVHEYKHHYCWVTEHYLGHDECFMR